MTTKKSPRRSPKRAKSPRRSLLKKKSPLRKYLGKLHKNKVSASVKAVESQLQKRRSPRRKSIDYGKLKKLFDKFARLSL